MQKTKLILLRSLARLIDLIFLNYCFGRFYDLLNRDVLLPHDGLFTGLQEMILFMPFCVLYELFFEYLSFGFTVGKFICGLRVRLLNGKMIEPKHAFFRWLGVIFDFYLTLGLGAIISAIYSKKAQRIGDRFAGTTVTMGNYKFWK
ncbi:hypothetical protein GOQ04_08470 [Emticicia sp. ODNR4P]|nr:hypothetical protein [Emticicia sp. ODNR4P]